MIEILLDVSLFFPSLYIHRDLNMEILKKEIYAHGKHNIYKKSDELF